MNNLERKQLAPEIKAGAIGLMTAAVMAIIEETEPEWRTKILLVAIAGGLGAYLLGQKWE